MAQETHETRDVPSDKVGEVVGAYYADGAYSVEVIAQPNGKFTVRAFYASTSAKFKAPRGG